MAYGKRYDEWDRVSLLAVLLHNDPEGRRPRLPITAFNPFADESSPETRAPDFKITDPRDLQHLVGGTLHVVT